MPLPSTAIACGTGDGLSIVIVTLPAFALSDFLSNLSWPLESAATVRLVDLPPALAPAPFWAFVVPPPGVGAVEDGVVCAALPVVDLLSLLPHPAAPHGARAVHSAAAGTLRFMGEAPSWVGSCGSTYALRILFRPL